MKISRIILTIFSVLVLGGLFGCQFSGSATKVGNPPKDLPEEPKAMTEKYLEENPYWKGSVGEETIISEDVYQIEFLVEPGLVKITSLSMPETVTIRFEILEDGSIVTIDDNGSGFTLTAVLNPDSFLYPLVMTLSREEEFSEMFSSSTADAQFHALFTNSEAACQATEEKCFDLDADLSADGSYFVASYVQAGTQFVKDCSRAIYDHCEIDGKILNEIVCDPASKFGFKVKQVECDCHDGRCVEPPPEEKMFFTLFNQDICITRSGVCDEPVIQKISVTDYSEPELSKTPLPEPTNDPISKPTAPTAPEVTFVKPPILLK